MKILSLSLALIGLTFFTYPFTIAKLSWGLAFGLLAGLGDGLANTASKYVGGKADDFALVVLRVSGGIVIGLSALIYTRQLYIPAISPTTLLIELIFGVLIIAATYTALVGFAHFDLNLGTIVISSELIFATVFAALLFHEYPTGWEIIGGSFIFAAIVASNYHGAGGFLNKYLKR